MYECFYLIAVLLLKIRHSVLQWLQSAVDFSLSLVLILVFWARRKGWGEKPTNKPKLKKQTNNKTKKTKNHVKTWAVPQKFSESQEPAVHQAMQTLPCFPILLREAWGICACQVGKRSLQVPQTKVLLLNHWIKNPNALPRGIWGFVQFCEMLNSVALEEMCIFCQYAMCLRQAVNVIPVLSAVLTGHLHCTGPGDIVLRLQGGLLLKRLILKRSLCV